MELSGKKAIVTGGTGTLGRVVVHRLMEAGARVAVPVSSRESLGHAHSAWGNRVLALVADLTAADDVQSFVVQVGREFGGVDILVAAAGGYAGGTSVEKTSLADTAAMMNLNFSTAFLMCQVVLPLMKASGFGRIITIASQPGVTPKAGAGAYAIAKRAVITLTETIAQETKGTGITANAIAPSILLTEENKRAMPDADFRKWVSPSDIAFLIHALCMDGARSLTGNVLKVYGGL
jgi:NAD(P)-dependent dehydrogenase (short-subunit alcohol dehydrogenase family)